MAALILMRSAVLLHPVSYTYTPLFFLLCLSCPCPMSPLLSLLSLSHTSMSHNAHSLPCSFLFRHSSLHFPFLFPSFLLSPQHVLLSHTLSVLTLSLTHSCTPGTDGSAGPHVISNDGCTLLLSWPTSAVCVDDFEPIDCVVLDDKDKL